MAWIVFCLSMARRVSSRRVNFVSLCLCAWLIGQAAAIAVTSRVQPFEHMLLFCTMLAELAAQNVTGEFFLTLTEC